MSRLLSRFKTNFAGINHPVILAAMGANSEIRIGQGSGLSGTTIAVLIRVEIGDRVGLGVNTVIYDNDFHHEDPILRCQQTGPLPPAAAVKICDDVWVGANSIILKGVTIGERAIIGAGSVVTRDVPPDTIFAGNPAHFIRMVKKEKI